MDYDTYNSYNPWYSSEFNYSEGQDFLPGPTINNLENPMLYNNKQLPEKHIPKNNQIESFTTGITITIPEMSEQFLITILLVVLIVICTLTYNMIKQTNESMKLLIELLKNNNSK